jgi:hypothetical protein
METKVLTQEEILELKSIRSLRTELIEQFGILELRIQEFMLQKEMLTEELKKLRQKEIELGEALQQKYGDGSIDLEKGEFTSN